MNIFKFWSKKPEVPKTETYIDLIISLNKNRQIDFSIFLDDKIEKIPINAIDYSVLCGEFFYTVLSDKMKKDSIEILNEQIKNNSNNELVDNIVSVIKIMNNSKSVTGSGSEQFIKPSEVFARYSG
jgi:predicted site-specific integrase-resolvase